MRAPVAILDHELQEVFLLEFSDNTHDQLVCFDNLILFTINVYIPVFLDDLI